jgi:hypothetical protein
LEALGEAFEAGYTLEEALALDTYFEEVYEEYLEIQEAVDLFYEYYLETGSVDEAEAEVSDIMSAAI